MNNKQILITGAEGQLGLTLQEKWQESGLAEDFDLCCTDIEQIDITSIESIQSFLANRPIAVIINGAAYTAVDRAESEEELAYNINKTGAENLAKWAKLNGARLIQVSTDFVFAGDKNTPYAPEDEPGPLSIYGKTKLAGELAVSSHCPDQSVIIRTSWLYSPYQANFVKTMLRLMQERDELSVVNDQIGSPTSTYSLVEFIFNVIKQSVPGGTFHWSDKGKVSWYDFALAIQQQGLDAGLLEKAIPIKPILTEQYPTPALRPKFSVLDTGEAEEKLSLLATPWEERLSEVINKLALQES